MPRLDTDLSYYTADEYFEKHKVIQPIDHHHVVLKLLWDELREAKDRIETLEDEMRRKQNVPPECYPWRHGD